MSVSFCLPHPVAVSAFMICRGLCACTEMLWMCVLYVSFGSKVRPRTFGCVAMGSALLFIVRSRLLVYSAGSGVNRVQVVLSGFSKRLFCFVQAKTLCRYGCMYFLAALVRVDVIVNSPPSAPASWSGQNDVHFFPSILLHCRPPLHQINPHHMLYSNPCYMLYSNPRHMLI